MTPLVMRNGELIIGDEKHSILDDFINGQSSKYERVDEVNMNKGLYVLIDFYGKITAWRRRE